MPTLEINQEDLSNSYGLKNFYYIFEVLQYQHHLYLHFDRDDLMQETWFEPKQRKKIWMVLNPSHPHWEPPVEIGRRRKIFSSSQPFWLVNPDFRRNNNKINP